MNYTETIDCDVCGGTGYVVFQISADDSDIEGCIDCDGTGKQIWELEGKNG